MMARQLLLISMIRIAMSTTLSMAGGVIHGMHSVYEQVHETTGVAVSTLKTLFTATEIDEEDTLRIPVPDKVPRVRLDLL